MKKLNRILMGGLAVLTAASCAQNPDLPGWNPDGGDDPYPSRRTRGNANDTRRGRHEQCPRRSDERGLGELRPALPDCRLLVRRQPAAGRSAGEDLGHLRSHGLRVPADAEQHLQVRGMGRLRGTGHLRGPALRHLGLHEHHHPGRPRRADQRREPRRLLHLVQHRHLPDLRRLADAHAALCQDPRGDHRLGRGQRSGGQTRQLPDRLPRLRTLRRVERRDG